VVRLDDILTFSEILRDSERREEKRREETIEEKRR
jgi:hypothetical protein